MDGNRAKWTLLAAIASAALLTACVGGSAGESGDAPEEAMKMIQRLRTFARNDEGQDLIEYALLVALIAVICVGAVTFAGKQVLAIFTSIGDSLAAAL